MSVERPEREGRATDRPDSVLTFSRFTFDTTACRLSRDGEDVHLTPKAAAVLCLLLRRPGELITKDEFLETVWEGVHVREESLTQAISVIRQTLGDSAQSPEYIQTVSGEGYRFIGEVSELTSWNAGFDAGRPGEATDSLQAETVPSVRAEAPSGSHATPRQPWRFVIPAVAVVAAVALIAALGSRPEAPERLDDPAEIRPLTSDGGQKWNERLSPDGTMVAFDWRGPDAESRDIWVKPIVPGAKYVQVTDNPAPERGPVWSSDGLELVFLRVIEGRASVWKAPVTGGEARKLFDIEGPANAPGGFSPTLTWSRDGRYVAFGERPVADQPSRIVVVDILAEEPLKKMLTAPPAEADSAGDLFPAFHPDSRQIAFARGLGIWGNWDIWIVDVNGSGPAQQVTHEEYIWLRNPVWSPDGEELFFQAGPYMDNLRTFRMGVNDGRPRYVEGLGINDRIGNVAGDRMVFRRAATDPQNVWAAPLRTDEAASVGARELIISIHHDLPTSFAPDGRLIFESDRSGKYQAWIASPDGKDARQLTEAYVDTNFTRWSPDDRHIAFDSRDSGNRDIWIQEVDSPYKRNLTNDPATDMWPTFSLDGHFVYFNSNRSGASQIWKAPVEGGEAEQVTQGGGAWGMEAADGYFYYAKSHGQTGIWRMPLGGGDETPVIAGPLDWAAWDLGPSGIYWAPGPPTSEEFTVRYRPFDSSESEVVYREAGIFARIWLRVSPDETMLVFGKRRPSTSELFLVENFR